MKLHWQEKKNKSQTYPSATWSTTNLTWAGMESKLGLSFEKLATNRLSHGTGFIKYYV